MPNADIDKNVGFFLDWTSCSVRAHGKAVQSIKHEL